MEGLFTALSRAVEGTPVMAAAAALVWGILSMVLSPCHLASIPLIVGFIDDQGPISTRRAFVMALLYSTGILITIGLVGLVTAGIGRMMGDVGRFGNYVVAAVFFMVGLHLLGVMPLPFLGSRPSEMKRKGTATAFVLGLVFGMALGPCTFAFMAPMLAVTFRLSSTNMSYGMLLLLLFGIGHCAVIVLAGTFTGMAQHYLSWNEQAQGTGWLKKCCGVLVLLGGLYFIYSAP